MLGQLIFLVAVTVVEFSHAVTGLPPYDVKPNYVCQAKDYVSIPANQCGPGAGLQSKTCSDLSYRCYCQHGLILMKFVKGCGNQDGGCQCPQYCGYTCQRSCNMDSPLCFWNSTGSVCATRYPLPGFNVSETGHSIGVCTLKYFTASPTTAGPTRQPTPPTTRTPTTHFPSTSPTSHPHAPSSSPTTPTTFSPSNEPTSSPTPPTTVSPTLSPSQSPTAKPTVTQAKCSITKIMGSFGTGQGQFQNVWRVAIDTTSGNMLVADKTKNSIQIFSKTSVFVHELFLPKYVTGVTVNPTTKDIYVLLYDDPSAGPFYIARYSGKSYALLAGPVLLSNIGFATFISLDPRKNGFLYVSDYYGTPSVYYFNPLTLKQQGSFGDCQSTNGGDCYSNPTDIAFVNGLLWLTDSENHRIVKLNPAKAYEYLAEVDITDIIMSPLTYNPQLNLIFTSDGSNGQFYGFEAYQNTKSSKRTLTYSLGTPLFSYSTVPDLKYNPVIQKLVVVDAQRQAVLLVTCTY